MCSSFLDEDMVKVIPLKIEIKKSALCQLEMSAQGENYASVGSVGRSAIPVNFIMAYGIAVLPAAIAGVALHGVDKAVLHLLHDAHMVGKAVLGAGAALVVIAIGNPPLLLPS